MMLESAARFGKWALMEQLLAESTLLGVPIDMPTYVKCLAVLAVHDGEAVKELERQIAGLASRDAITPGDVAYVTTLVD